MSQKNEGVKTRGLVYVTVTTRRPTHCCPRRTMHGQDLAPIGCLAEMNYNVNHYSKSCRVEPRTNRLC